MKNVEDLGPGDTVAALSLHQPWASLMATGAAKTGRRLRPAGTPHPWDSWRLRAGP